jgi:hypothetical protein
MNKPDHRHIGESDLAGGQQTAMAGDDHIVRAGQDRID